MIKNKDLFDFDNNIRKKYKCKLLSGSDEVGRGAMAGPIVVCSLVLKENYFNENIKDSKKLSDKQRRELYDEILENSLSYSIKEYDNLFVDKFNPKATSKIGMKETIESLNVKPEICLIDGEDLNLDRHETIKLIKGDSLSMSIAAASIVAKVYRDNIMIEFSKLYNEYNFEKHKGYCTKDHIDKVKEFGVLSIHRFSYKPIKDLV